MKKHQNLKVLFLCFLCSAMSPFARGQDIEHIGKSITTRVQQNDILRLKGRLYANLRYNDVYGIPPRADPFSLRFNAQLNVDFLGVKAPFSAAFSDGDPTFHYPAYAFCGASPTYKWATLHLGDRVLNFSPYTLSGHHFSGIGFEVKPGKFYLAAFSGRLRRARPEDAGKLQRLDPVYKRRGWGVKAGISDGENSIHLILFAAHDLPGSLHFSDTSRTVSPEENVTLGLQVRRKVGKLAAIDLDFGRSALTRDSRSPAAAESPRVPFYRMAGLFKPNLSSGYHNAFKATLSLKPGFGDFNAQFEKIDPGYRSLGALFFNNDLENFTLGGRIPLFTKKAFVALNSGIQRSITGRQSAPGLHRFIGSIDLSAQPRSRLNASLSLSNFSTTTRATLVRTPFVDTDSLILTQTNASAYLAVTYFGGKTKRSVWILAGSFQKANAIEGDQIRADLSHAFKTAMVSHTFTTGAGGWKLNSSCLANFTAAQGSGTTVVGPALTVSKAFGGGKWEMSSSVSNSLVFQEGELINRVFNIRCSSGFQPGKNQGIDFGLFYTRAREGPPGGFASGFREWNFSVAYTYRLI